MRIVFPLVFLILVGVLCSPSKSLRSKHRVATSALHGPTEENEDHGENETGEEKDHTKNQTQEEKGRPFQFVLACLRLNPV